MAVVSITHTVKNISSTARKVGGKNGFLLKSGETVKIPQDRITKDDQDLVGTVFTVAPALPATVENLDQLVFELSRSGSLVQVLSGPAADIPHELQFKASGIVAAFSFGTGGGAASGIDLARITLKNESEYDLTEVVFLDDQSANEVVLWLRP